MSFVIRYIVSSTGPDEGQRLAAFSMVSSRGITNCSRTLIQNFSSGDAGVGGSFAARAQVSSGVTNGAAPPMARSRANSRRFMHPPRPGGSRTRRQQPVVQLHHRGPQDRFYATLYLRGPMISSTSRFHVTGLALLVWLGVPPIDATGQVDYETVRGDRRLRAVRTAAPITLDGVLDEAAWRDAPVATGFLQSEPNEGEPASEQTEVRVLYDDANLYIGMFAHDSSPGDIIVSDLKKDFDPIANDAFEVILDTFHDERNGYRFATNAMGAKWDAQMVNEGRDINSNWDGIWSVQTRIVKTGWYAEIMIPFRTLRFADADAQIWGINFLRRVRRRNEDSLWAPLPRIYRIDRVSMAGTLEGLRGVRPGSDLRLKPYVLSSGHTIGTNRVDGDVQAGVDAKYGVTSSLTWDFTVNTDFSQVEADEQQVTLTRFSLLFPEKRDFFLENSGVFQFGPGNQQGGGGGGGGGGGAGGGGTGG